ncbi:MAG: DUF5930 domain-containing protein [Pseudomonadota bacterium]
MPSILERLFPEREIYVRSNGSVRYITLGQRVQILTAAAIVGLVGWAGYASMRALASTTQSAHQDEAMLEIREAYEARVQRLQDRYQRLQAELNESERRFDDVIQQISSKHGQLTNETEFELALEGRLEASRRRLREVTAQRDETLTRLEEMRLSALEMERNLIEAQRAAEQRRDSLDDFVATLDETVGERDEARTTVRALTRDVDVMTRKIEEIKTHQKQVMAQLSEATEASIGELERILKRAGVDVDGLVKEIERTYSGEGGPFIPILYRVPTASADLPINENTVAEALDRLQRINSLKIALERLPFAKPIRASYRFTSGFGPRRHPITKRWTAHHGVDMAAPRGTPVHSPVDGVVTYAAMQRGYGNVVKIRHALGYETVYAHLDKIHVTKGETVERGHRVGDVGSTGRSTGNHLHYEIRRYRKPLNPVPYFKAGDHVF